MKLIIIRHGETNENAQRIVQGQRVGTLSPQGRHQAKKLAQRLKHEKIDIVFSSDLERARKTTQEIVRFHPDTPVEYTLLLRERNLTVFEGKPIAEYSAVREKSGMLKHLWKPPGGESYLDILERARQFLDKVLKEHRDKTILAVTHVGFIRALLSIVLNKPIQETTSMELPNTSITIIEIKSDHKYEVNLLGCTGHLDSKNNVKI